MSIGQLAEHAGVSVRALRYYEDQELLAPSSRTAAGHRRYDDRSINDLYRVLALRRLGLSLAEIRTVAKGSETSLLEIARHHLEAVTAELVAATALRDRLRDLLDRGANTNSSFNTLEVVAMTVRLDQITTRAGDDGDTALASGPRVSKASARVAALGTVDELNAALGVALAQIDTVEGDRPRLARIQQQLFELGADVAHPGAPPPQARVDEADIEALESVVTAGSAGLAPLASFVVPGGGPYAVHLHQCRAICRRAERDVVAALAEEKTHEEGHAGTSTATRYLNRLSDALFVLARHAAERSDRGHQLWEPRPTPR